MYSRKLDDRVLSFGHEGILYQRSFIMYDKQTNSLWIHTTGEAVKGPLKGKVLRFLPSTVTTWKKWKAMHPKTVVLTGQRGSKFMGHFGLGEDMTRYGFSVGQGKNPKLYAFPQLASARVINDTHAGQPIVLYFDPEGRTARAWARGTHTFSWKDGKVTDETGAAWDLLRGLSGGEQRTRLRQVAATVWLVDRWQAFHREGAVYKSK